ncbi:MAG: DUF6326 family protein [Bacteroidota bacterium]
MTILDQHSIPFSRKSLLSTLWIFVLMNMIYADILGTLKPGYLDQLERLSTELTSTSVLTFSILMEIPIVMILLSRVLDYRANRWANFIAVPLAILWVVVPTLMPSLGDGTPISYLFFATVESEDI